MERLNIDKLKVLAAAATLAMFAGTACAETELYATVNRAIMHTDDGHQASTLFVDNAFAPSTVGVKTSMHIDKCTTMGAVAAFQLNANDSRMVNQINNDDIGTNLVQVRYLDTFVQGWGGKLSLGYGDAASYGITRMSYARTGDTVSSSRVGDLAGGMLFHTSGSASDASYANPSINMTFDSLDGVGSFDSLTGVYRQKNRIRWDSDNWNGLMLSASFGSVQERDIFISDYTDLDLTTRSYADVALRYEGNFDDFMLSAGIAYAQYSKSTSTANNDNGTTVPTTTPALAKNNRLWAGSIAVEHKCTGINAAFSYGNKSQIVPASNNAKAWFVQLGKHFGLMHQGKTNVVLDYFQGSDTLANNDKSKSYAIGVVQDFDKINSSMYATVRGYKYSHGVTRAGVATNFNNIWAGSVGFIVKFGAML